MNLTRREALHGGSAAVVGIAAAGAVAAAVPAVTGDDARLEELYRAWQEAEAEYERLAELYGDLYPSDPREPQVEADVQAADDRSGDAMLALAAVPAVGVRGVLIKLQAWDDDGGDGRRCTEAVRESAFADLRRLAWRAPS